MVPGISNALTRYHIRVYLQSFTNRLVLGCENWAWIFREWPIRCLWAGHATGLTMPPNLKTNLTFIYVQVGRPVVKLHKFLHVVYDRTGNCSLRSEVLPLFYLYGLWRNSLTWWKLELPSQYTVLSHFMVFISSVRPTVVVLDARQAGERQTSFF